MMISIIFVLFTFLHDHSEAIHHLEKRQLVTCPGFAGYCSEAYPGGVCTVVCAFGRPNVPECQPDGTWTDIPRCIEHEPGKEEQTPGFCPGIPGYCSDDRSGGVCEFDCLIGPDIRSFCTKDGTWEPYPTCQGDIRETRDGCDGCPGKFGGARNRTAEAASGGAAASRRKNAGPSQPARPAARPNQRNQAKPAARPANNRRNQGAKRKNQGSRRRNQSQGARKRPTAQASRAQRPKRPQPRPAPRPAAPRQQAAPVRQQQKQQRPAQNALVKSQPKPAKPAAPAGNKREVSSGSGKKCPGGSLEACIDVCPSFSARIFGACVAGCAKRCPSNRK